MARFYWPMRERIGDEHFDRYSEQQRVTAQVELARNAPPDRADS